MGKNVLITGATGLIGRRLVKEFLQRGDNVFAITTNVASAQKKLAGIKKFVNWNDYLSLTDKNINIIVHLAGRNMGEKRWSEEFKQEGYKSRINTTRKIAELAGKMKSKPDVLLSASGVDYYGNRGEEMITEESSPAVDFMGRMCVDWESEALKAENYGVRTVVLRTGFVIAKNAPAVNKMVFPFRLFVGGTLGSGRQYMSWIHIDDLAGIYLYAADNSNIRGAVNATAPNPETMKQFCKSIAKSIHRPALFRVPSIVIKIAVGEMSQVILNGRKAVPGKITQAGYKFKFLNSIDAWKDVLE